MTDIRVGTCGYRYYDPGENWQERYESKLAAYSAAFDAGEINRTFYDLPRVSTAERWRREARDGFAFTVKAWQAVTHEWSSPTWNGHRDAVREADTDTLGALRPTDPVHRAWDATMERARALDAAAVLVQTPPSFDASDEHAANMRELLGEVDREGAAVAWEPRGDWDDHPGRVADLCRDLELVHVVDVMRREPLDETDLVYTRLHGLNEERYEYNYDYSDDELAALADELEELADDHEAVYCLFNNVEMYANATALQGLFTAGR